MMIILGRPGLWHDWQRFQAKARVARREAEIEAAQRRKKIVEGSIIAVFVLCCLAVLGALAMLILHHQGDCDGSNDGTLSGVEDPAKAYDVYYDLYVHQGH